MTSGVARRNVWVISDTHLKSGNDLPVEFVNRVNREDLIIHLGDFIGPNVVDFLEKRATLAAVSGNCDPPAIRRAFPTSRIIMIGNIKVGLMHGSGGETTALARARNQFGGAVDVVLFGHTHKPYHFRDGRTLYFNPGSLTEGRGRPAGYGLLHLDEGTWGELFEL